MRPYIEDDRTRLLLKARAMNGVKVVVDNDRDQEVMDAMTQEGLFNYSSAVHSVGYWWTPTGEQAAELAWRQLPVWQFDTSHRGHPQVHFSLNGSKEELCHVSGPDYPATTMSLGLWVRGSRSNWLVDHPSGTDNERFTSADDAIEWALQQVGQA